MRTEEKMILIGALAMAAVSCDKFPAVTAPEGVREDSQLSLEEIAKLFSSLPMQSEHLEEVYSAVNISSENGYDEEYTMADLFESPGSGVGGGTKVAKTAARPLKTLIEEYLEGQFSTKGGFVKDSVERYIAALSSSDLQIYWPYSDAWDGDSYPVITFDPGNESQSNIGFELVEENGARRVREIVVDEDMAMSRPVWVINSNDDSKYTSYEMLRRSHPEWGNTDMETKAAKKTTKTLVVKKIRMNRNFDSWFGGASEFWFKCGAVEGFTANTEAELKMYQPSVTDFMIVVKRKNKGLFVPFDAIMISDWTEQLDKIAFMVTEDDGGTRTSWKCDAVVKVQSKSYGLTIDLPYNERDDIVWRGSLSSSFFEDYRGEICHFGDMDIIFDIR